MALLALYYGSKTLSQFVQDQKLSRVFQVEAGESSRSRLTCINKPHALGLLRT